MSYFLYLFSSSHCVENTTEVKKTSLEKIGRKTLIIKMNLLSLAPERSHGNLSLNTRSFDSQILRVSKTMWVAVDNMFQYMKLEGDFIFK